MFPSHVAWTVYETGALKASEEALLLRVLLTQLHEAPIEHLRAPLTLADRPQVPEKLDSFVVPSRLARAPMAAYTCSQAWSWRGARAARCRS